MTKEQTKQLYLTTHITQRELAAQAGVSEKTIYLWIKQGRWKELKTETLPPNAQLIEDIYAQMLQLTAQIKNYNPGYRYGSDSQVEKLRKLAVILNILKKHEPVAAEEPEEEITGFPAAAEKPETEPEMGEFQVVKQIENQQVEENEGIPAPEKSRKSASNSSEPDQQSAIPVPVTACNEDPVRSPAEIDPAKHAELADFKGKMHNRKWKTYYDYRLDFMAAHNLVKPYIANGSLPQNYCIFNLIPQYEIWNFND